MKVYDTDEKAVASYQRKQMLIKAIMVGLMLVFSGLGIYGLMQWLEPSAHTESLPTTTAYYASPAAGCVMAVPPVGVDLSRQDTLLAA